MPVPTDGDTRGTGTRRPSSVPGAVPVTYWPLTACCDGNISAPNPVFSGLDIPLAIKR